MTAKTAKTAAKAAKATTATQIAAFPAVPATPRRRAPRKTALAAPVEMTDKSAPITAARMESYEVGAAIEAARAVQAMAVTDVLARHARG